MSSVDDRIRTALDAGVPEALPIEPTALADGLRDRAVRRRRSRRRARGAAAAGALVLVSLLASTVVLRDGSDVHVVADGSDAAVMRRPVASRLVGMGYQLAPELDRSLANAADALIFVGEVRAVGDERPVAMTVPTGPEAGIPMPTVDFSPVEVDVLEYLHVDDGVLAPDPIRLRMIAMGPFGGLVGSGTTSTARRAPLTELLPIGSHILVFANAPGDVGDGLAATPDTVYPLTEDGVIDEDGTVVPMDEVRARLTASGEPSTQTSTTVLAPDPADGPGPDAGAEVELVQITVEAYHCEPLTSGSVTVAVWVEPATGRDPIGGDDVGTSDAREAGWWVLDESVPVVAVTDGELSGGDGSSARSHVTVDVPPKAAQWLVAYQEQGGALWVSPTPDDMSCLGATAPTIPS